MLVLDKSGSIDSSGATGDGAERDQGVPERARRARAPKVSITDFSTTAAQQVPYTTVTPTRITTSSSPISSNGYKPSGWTNWEAAFQKVGEANTEGTQADLVVFITDGDPTARNNPTGQPDHRPHRGRRERDARRPREADKVKEQGSHVFALGVGAAVTKATSARRLTAISGLRRVPRAADFSEADYTLVKNFDKLAAALRQIASSCAEASVTVTKLVDEGDGDYRPDAGWRFTATVATSPGGYTWVQPARRRTGARTRVDQRRRRGDLPVEAVQRERRRARSRRRGRQARLPVRRRRTARSRESSRRQSQASRPPNADHEAQATAHNRARPVREVHGPQQDQPGTIEIEKRRPRRARRRSPSRARSARSGSWTTAPTGPRRRRSSTNLRARDLHGQRAGPRRLGAHRRHLHPRGGRHDRRRAGDDHARPERRRGVHVQRQRIEPPHRAAAEPTPSRPTPAAPHRRPDDAARTPPAAPPAPGVRGPDAAPGRADPRREAGDSRRARRRPGPVRLTVTNTGSVAATNVRVADIPPAALELTGLRPPAARAVIRGNAVWRFGTLAPGARRTVRGSVVIEAGTPGLMRNLALATADNAQLAVDRADTRILGARTAPNFTG